MKKKEPIEQRTVRCAIYTRKSTDEGLEQDFNTLDAQRESAEAYIRSQQHEGWLCLPDRYDDGGFTGGNMDRPALKRLLKDVEDGKVDCCVVYKVDRLSRSLIDFTKIMEVLENHGATFVSVTQHFNTTNSMGRLTLNILLSFAQFEREIISERTRDKMTAARRKGKWMGGMLLLGYDVDSNKRLIVNEGEAARVREIFNLYLRERSLLPVVRGLRDQGWTAKRWQTARGDERGGRPFDKNSLHALLTNVTYAGKVSHKGEIHEGEHEAIVTEEVWRQTQDLLRANRQSGGRDVRNRHGSLLKGRLYCEFCYAAMVHSFTRRGKRLYRYYVCSSAQKKGWDTCPTKSLPAADVERVVVDTIRSIGADPALAKAAIEQARRQNIERLQLLIAEEVTLQKELARLAKNQRAMPETSESQQDGEEQGERMREAEQRLTRTREEILDLQALTIDEKGLTSALDAFFPVWDALKPEEKARVMQLLVERVGYDPATSRIAITFHPASIRALQNECAVNN